MIAIGRPYCTDRLMVPTSRVTRVTRSPVLALSTWPSGSRRIVPTMNSRAEASRSCPKRVETHWPRNVNSAWAQHDHDDQPGQRGDAGAAPRRRSVDELAEQARHDEPEAGRQAR